MTALLWHCLSLAVVSGSGDIWGAHLDDACAGDPRNLPLEFVQGQVLSEQRFAFFQSHVLQEVKSWGRL